MNSADGVERLAQDRDALLGLGLGQRERRRDPQHVAVPAALAQQQAASAAGGGAQMLFSTVITGSLVSVIPLIVSFLFLQRYWQTGLAAGGVKG